MTTEGRGLNRKGAKDAKKEKEEIRVYIFTIETQRGRVERSFITSL
jgi:hypothetical protein